MAKAPSSVIGVDLGRYALKSVLLQRRGSNRFAVTNYATHVLTEPVDSADTLARHLKSLFKEMGGTAKSCAIGVSSPDALIRIIEQPETPPAFLREALRLNGMQLLNQDCKEMVLDCDKLPGEPTPNPEGNGARHRYLVGGLPQWRPAPYDAVAYELPAEMDGGLVFLLGDGRVEFREMRRAMETLARAAAPPPTPS